MTKLNELAAFFEQIARDGGPLDDEAIDAAIGLERDKVESALNLGDLLLRHGQHRMEAADTSYALIRDLYRVLPFDSTAPLLDLGSGYGRIGFFGALAYRRAVYGIEIVPERVAEALRVRDQLGLSDLQVIAGDVLTIAWPRVPLFLALNPVTPRLTPALVARLESTANIQSLAIVSIATSNAAFRSQRWLREVVPDCPSAALPANLRLFFSR